MMALENIKNTEADSKSPSKRRNPDVKTEAEGTPPEIALEIRRKKKNTPKKSFGDSDLNFIQIKIFNQRMKITLMTDFFKSIVKNTFVPFHEKPPDPM